MIFSAELRNWEIIRLNVFAVPRETREFGCSRDTTGRREKRRNPPVNQYVLLCHYPKVVAQSSGRIRQGNSSI